MCFILGHITNECINITKTEKGPARMWRRSRKFFTLAVFTHKEK
jgi:hypothetical protein